MLKSNRDKQALTLDVEYAGVGLSCAGNSSEVHLWSQGGLRGRINGRWELSHEEVVKLACKVLSIDAVGVLVPHSAIPAHLSPESKLLTTEREQAIRAFEAEYEERFGTRRDQLGTSTVVDNLNKGHSISWGSALTVTAQKSRGPSGTVMRFDASGPVSIELIADALTAFLSDYRTLKDHPDYAISLRRWGERAFEGSTLRKDISNSLTKGVKLPNPNGDIDEEIEEENPFLPSVPRKTESIAQPTALPNQPVHNGSQKVTVSRPENTSVSRVAANDGAPPQAKTTGSPSSGQSELLSPGSQTTGSSFSLTETIGGLVGQALGYDEEVELYKVEEKLRELKKLKKELDRRTEGLNKREQNLNEREKAYEEDRRNDPTLRNIDRANDEIEAAKQDLITQRSELAGERKALRGFAEVNAKRAKELDEREAALKKREDAIQTSGASQTLVTPTAGPAPLSDAELTEREAKLREAEASNASVARRLQSLENELKVRQETQQKKEEAFRQERSSFEQEWIKKDAEYETIRSEAEARIEEAKAIEKQIAEFLRVKVINPEERA